MTPASAAVFRRALLMIVRHIERSPDHGLPAPVLRRASCMVVAALARHPRTPLESAVMECFGLLVTIVEDNELP